MVHVSFLKHEESNDEEKKSLTFLNYENQNTFEHFVLLPVRAEAGENMSLTESSSESFYILHVLSIQKKCFS